MQRDKLTADLKYFTTCLVHSILIVHFDASFNQHQHGNNLSALNAHMTILEYCEIQSWSHTDTELKEIKGKKKHRLLIQLERKMYQEPNKQGMRKVNMMATVTTTSKDIYYSPHAKIEVIHQQQVKSDVMKNTNILLDI